MTFNIAVASRSFSQHPQLREALLKVYPNTKFNDEGKSLKGEELIDFLKDADKAIIALEKIDKSVLNHLPKLKLISKYGVGLDNIHFQDLLEKNILLSWQGGVNKRAVSELALSFILLTLRKSHYANLAIKNNNWHQVQGHNLTGKTVGLIGFGHIGQDLSLLLKPFGIRILANDILDRSKEASALGVELCSKEMIYKEADAISLHLPITKHTKNIINSTVLKSMKPNAVVINTARGGLINESDLLTALNDKTITAAAVDVFTEEPDIDQDLLHHPHFFCTPHIGGSSKEAIFLMGMAAIAGLETGKEALISNFFEYPVE